MMHVIAATLSRRLRPPLPTAYQAYHPPCASLGPPCRKNSRWSGYVYGLAPGGVVQVWVWNECYQPVKSIRVVAEEEPRGPHLGTATGYYPLTEDARGYVERWGIPYGSW